MILLIGLMAKNGILIVEFANQLRDEGSTIREAVLEASALRLRPIVMTVLVDHAGRRAAGAGDRRRRREPGRDRHRRDRRPRHRLAADPVRDAGAVRPAWPASPGRSTRSRRSWSALFRHARCRPPSSARYRERAPAERAPANEPARATARECRRVQRQRARGRAQAHARGRLRLRARARRDLGLQARGLGPSLLRAQGRGRGAGRGLLAQHGATPRELRPRTGSRWSRPAGSPPIRAARATS